MKYPYHIEYISRGYPVMRLPAEIDPVSTFLFSDVQLSRSSGEYYLSAIDRVLSGDVPFWEVMGNACDIEVKKDFTQVTDRYESDEVNNPCTIETSELRELIVIWMDAVEHRPDSQGTQ
jgi:hypothetical protein